MRWGVNLWKILSQISSSLARRPNFSNGAFEILDMPSNSNSLYLSLFCKPPKNTHVHSRIHMVLLKYKKVIAFRKQFWQWSDHIILCQLDHFLRGWTEKEKFKKRKTQKQIVPQFCIFYWMLAEELAWPRQTLHPILTLIANKSSKLYHLWPPP